MMILKKKEIIAASLVVLIGMAGYLNWSYQDTVRVRDNESYVETGKTLGEAEMVSSNNEAEREDDADEAEDAEDTDEAEDAASVPESTAAPVDLEDAKMSRESARSQAMETLKATSSDDSVDENTRKLAGEKLVACAENIELESTVENVAAAKGFSELCAYINEGTATVTVKCGELSEDDAAKLIDIVTGTANIPADKVKIIEVR